MGKGSPGAEGGELVQLNVLVPRAIKERLRDRAYEERRSQSVIVVEALSREEAKAGAPKTRRHATAHK